MNTWIPLCNFYMFSEPWLFSWAADILYGWQMEALQFASRLENVLSRVLPVLGSMRDSQRRTFANGKLCCVLGSRKTL
jgi:hypothetical protein